MPEVPVEPRDAAAALPADTVAITCDSYGAERVIALVPPEWVDSRDDTTRSKRIAEFME